MGDWVDQLAPGQQHWLRSTDVITPQLLEEFDAELTAAQVGWRLMVAGPEVALALLRARALAAGAVPSEIQAVLADTAALTNTAVLTVYCVHCAVSFDSAVRIGDTVVCGCRRVLHIRPHFSPRLGAYLGAAEPPVPQ